MALLQKIKEALGFGSGSSDRESGDPTVTVENTHEAIDPTTDEADGDAVPEPSSKNASSAAAPGAEDTETVAAADAEADPTATGEKADAAAPEAVEAAETESETVEAVEAESETVEASTSDSGTAEATETTDGDPVEQITGIGPAYGERLEAMGIETVEDLAGADPAAVADETSVGEKRATTWIDRANDF